MRERAPIEMRAEQPPEDKETGAGVISKLSKKIGKKGRALAGALSLLGATGTAEMAVPEKAEAHHEQTAGTESEQQQQKREQFELAEALESWKGLKEINTVDIPMARTKAQERGMRRRSAEKEIHHFGARLQVGPDFQAKSGEQVRIMPISFQHAVELLARTAPKACAVEKGSDCSAEEAQKFWEDFSKTIAGEAVGSFRPNQ